MTAYQIYTRLRHGLMSRYWRGHGVHSPMMYRFVREVVMQTPRSRLEGAIVARYGVEQGVVVIVDSMTELIEASQRADVIVFREPFRTAAEYGRFREWYEVNSVVVAHLQGLMVLFFDPRLKKQSYCIRS